MGDLTKNFSRYEFECKCGCGLDSIDIGVVFGLQIIRDYFDAAMTINSACRCHQHNLNIGGADNSLHLAFKAADFTIDGVLPSVVADFIDSYFGGNNGLGRYNTFTHFDIRAWSRARWGL